jgi:hypothetical protein
MQNSRKKHAKAAPLCKPRRLGISPSSKWALRGAKSVRRRAWYESWLVTPCFSLRRRAPEHAQWLRS